MVQIEISLELDKQAIVLNLFCKALMCATASQYKTPLYFLVSQPNPNLDVNTC